MPPATATTSPVSYPYPPKITLGVPVIAPPLVVDTLTRKPVPLPVTLVVATPIPAPVSLYPDPLLPFQMETDREAPKCKPFILLTVCTPSDATTTKAPEEEPLIVSPTSKVPDSVAIDIVFLTLSCVINRP